MPLRPLSSQALPRSVQERHAQFPDTFCVPSLEDASSLQPAELPDGCYAHSRLAPTLRSESMVHLNSAPAGRPAAVANERFWVRASSSRCCCCPPASAGLPRRRPEREEAQNPVPMPCGAQVVGRRPAPFLHPPFVYVGQILNVLMPEKPRAV